MASKAHVRMEERTSTSVSADVRNAICIRAICSEGGGRSVLAPFLAIQWMHSCSSYEANATQPDTCRKGGKGIQSWP